MRAVIQRVSEANVKVDGTIIAEIDNGFLVLIGVEEDDNENDAKYIANKIAGLRIFEDADGKLNEDIKQAKGAVLLVSQFTLYGDARKGRRPSFIKAANNDKAISMIKIVREIIEKEGIGVQEGEFGAHMDVSLVNDGPITILLDSSKEF